MTTQRKRIAIFSDIHSNNLALEAVLADLKALEAIDSRNRVDAYWCLGDMIGRGPEPIPVLETLYALYQQQTDDDKKAWLVGNHDLLVIGTLPQEVFRSANSKNAEVVGESGLTESVIIMALHNRRRLDAYKDKAAFETWLKSLPTLNILPHGIAVVHGAYLWDNETNKIKHDETYMFYTDNEVHIRNQFKALHQTENSTNPVKLLLNGHTHISKLAVFAPNERRPKDIEDHLNKTLSFDLTENRVYINPGSIGFPRPPRTYPTYAILTLYLEDEILRKIDVYFREVTYDPTPYVSRLKPGETGLLARADIPQKIYEEVLEHCKEDKKD